MRLPFSSSIFIIAPLFPPQLCLSHYRATFTYLYGTHAHAHVYSCVSMLITGYYMYSENSCICGVSCPLKHKYFQMKSTLVARSAVSVTRYSLLYTPYFYSSVTSDDDTHSHSGISTAAHTTDACNLTPTAHDARGAGTCCVLYGPPTRNGRYWRQ